MRKAVVKYRLVSEKYVSVSLFKGRKILQIEPEALTVLAKQAVIDVSHFLRTSHLKALRTAADDPQASDNDRYVAETLLENAVISAEGIFPGCQDTGTAIVMGKKGEYVFTDINDAEYLSKGIFQAYDEANLRYSQTAALSMFEEVNTGTNLPAQIDISSVPGSTYEFLFITKGGGSANKTFLFQETKGSAYPAKNFFSLSKKKQLLSELPPVRPITLRL